MSSSGMSTKSVRNLEKPKPLRLNASRSVRPVSIASPTETTVHSNRLSSGSNSVLELMGLLNKVSNQLSNAQYDVTLTNNIDMLYTQMKLYGSQIEPSYQSEVDTAFVPIRNGTVNEKLDEASRLKLLHLVELRSAGWKSLHTDYYSQTLSKANNDLELSSLSTHSIDSLLSPLTPPPNLAPVLGPGELVKTSGKYPKPTKIPGKNYCKDEVVIRNADSGKVMGIKGRRVHMIEELSETIISFQRVHPGARERNVQITGPNPENIVHATHLIDETIRKNMSPVRELGLEDSILLDSNSSLNSSQSDDSGLKLLHSDDQLDFANYRHTLSFGNNRHITIVGNDYTLVNNVVVLVVQNKNAVAGVGNTQLVSPISLEDDLANLPSQRMISSLHHNMYVPASPLAMTSPLRMSFSPSQDYMSSVSHLDLDNNRSTLSRSKSDIDPLLVEVAHPLVLPSSTAISALTHSMLQPSSTSMTNTTTSLLTNKLSRKYSREFLIMCSKSPLSQCKPPDMVYMELNYPEILKKPEDGQYFDAVEYLTQCELNRNKPKRIVNISSTDLSDDYDYENNNI